MSIRPMGPSQAGLAGAYAAKPGVPAGAFTRLMCALYEGEQSTGLTVIGDSTGYTAGKTRWPYLLDDWLAATFPAYSVQTLTWNEGNQAYDAPVIVGGGSLNRVCTLGGVGCLDHPGDGTAITGDIDVRVKVAFPTWAPGPSRTGVLAARWTAGQKSWRLYMNSGGSAGQLTFEWSADGSTSVAAKNSTALAGVTAGTPLWVRATLTASTGQVNFYTSTDGIVWSSVSVPTAAGATSLYDPGTNQVYQLGADSGGANPVEASTAIYEVEVRKGIGGTSTIPRWPDCWVGHNSASTFTLSGKPVMTILNGSIPGAAIAYLTDTTRFPKLCDPAYATSAIVLSCSHNDLSNGAPYLALWDAWLTQIRTRTKAAEVAVTIQNPKTSPGQTNGTISAQRVRCHEQRVWAARNHLSIIDVYRAYQESATGLASLVDATDGIHPSDATGSPLWAATVEAALLGHH